MIAVPTPAKIFPSGYWKPSGEKDPEAISQLGRVTFSAGLMLHFMKQMSMFTVLALGSQCLPSSKVVSRCPLVERWS